MPNDVKEVIQLLRQQLTLLENITDRELISEVLRAQAKTIDLLCTPRLVIPKDADISPTFTSSLAEITHVK